MRLSLIPSLLLAGSAAAAAQDDAQFQTQVAAKVMPLGASIVTDCWRAKLWKNLTDHGIVNMNWVGTQKGKDCGFPYDSEHEGHSGRLAIETVEKNYLPPVLESQSPDVIVMLLGSNDVIQKKQTTDIISAYTTLVEQMRASNPRMQIVIAQLPPITKYAGLTQAVIDLNSAIAEWGPRLSTPRSPIYIVDQYTGFNTTTDTPDGLHPNESGNVKLSQKFYPAVSQALLALQGGVQDVPSETYEPPEGQDPEEPERPDSTPSTTAEPVPTYQTGPVRWWSHGRPPAGNQHL